ncbi:MAG TPA: YfiR family protein [Spongiibacteraceae bacterium]|nr:YfiR family protein [Spongiibacteraceae bacterium]
MSFLMRGLSQRITWLLFFFLPMEAIAQEESAVRAAMIFNLLKFTNWPSSVSAQAPLRVCLNEASPAFKNAMTMLDERVVGSHILKITERISNQTSGCEVIVTDAEKNAYDPAKLVRQGILTIGDGHYIDRGGMIGIVKIGNRIRFEINATTMQDAGVSVSSKVLQLAMRVL